MTSGPDRRPTDDELLQGETPALRVQVLKLRGELNMEDVAKITALAKEYLVAGQVRLVLELSNVSHVHLAALPQLVQMAKRFREYRGDLKLAAASPYVKHLLQVAGASSSFDQWGTLEKACHAFEVMG